MIKFDDSGEKNTLPELPKLLDFHDIIPADIQSTEVVLGFWNRFFGKLSCETAPEIDDQQIINEVYGRSVTEFSFDFEIDETLQYVLDRFQEAQWAELPENQKVIIAREFLSILAQKMELSTQPELELYNGSEGDYGRYSPGTNTIGLNREYLSDPKATVDTIAHEIRHAYQYERAQKQETHTDFLYLYNMNHYVRPTFNNGYYINFLDYYGQYIEAEARAFANLFSNKGASK